MDLVKFLYPLFLPSSASYHLQVQVKVKALKVLVAQSMSI